jgi:hypothetical protein
VTFCDATINTTCRGLAVIGAAQLTSSGSASIVVRLGIGSHSLEAVFAGNTAYASSASSISPLAVTGKYASATSILAVPGSGSGVYDLAATIYGFGPLSLAPPTGTVNFVDAGNSNTQLASAPLNTGVTGSALSFVNSSTPAMSGLAPSSVVTGDFNGDGKLDFAVADQTNNQVAIFLGNGDGTFQSGASFKVGNGPVSIAAGDMNNDGKLDLVICNYGDNTVLLLSGNGDGTFRATESYPVGTGPVFVTLGDLNGDGTLDAILAIDDNETRDCIPFGSVEVLLGNGDGTLRPPIDSCLDTPIGGAEPLYAITGDFNGDGKLDVVTANRGQEATYTVSILLGNGDGTLTSAGFLDDFSIVQPASSVGAADFNGDGKLDIALTNGSSPYTGPGQSSYSIILGNGDGTFQEPVTTGLAVNTNPSYLQIADFNGDGKADLVIGTGNGDDCCPPIPTGLFYVLLGNGDGTFTPPLSYQTASLSGFSSGLAVGDFNGDGKPDLVSLPSGGPGVFLSTGPSVTVIAAGVPVTGDGSELIEASYGGDSVYGSSTSPTISLKTTASSSVFTIVPASTSLTVTQSGLVIDTLSVTAAAGYIGSVQFSCSGLPQNSSCVFQPSSVKFTGANTPATVTLTIRTGVSSAAKVNSITPASPDDLPLIPAVVFLMPGWLAAALGGRVRSRSHLRSVMRAIFILTAACAITGCGGGTGGNGMTSSQTPGGTSMVQVIVIGSGPVTQSATIKLTVQ